MASAKLPTPDELKAVGRQLGDDPVRRRRRFLSRDHGPAAWPPITRSRPWRIPMPLVEVSAHPGYRPMGADNKYNAWYYKSEVKGAPSGKLEGKRRSRSRTTCAWPACP